MTTSKPFSYTNDKLSLRPLRDVLRPVFSIDTALLRVGLAFALGLSILWLAHAQYTQIGYICGILLTLASGCNALFLGHKHHHFNSAFPSGELPVELNENALFEKLTDVGKTTSFWATYTQLANIAVAIAGVAMLFQLHWEPIPLLLSLVLQQFVMFHEYHQSFGLAKGRYHAIM